MRAILDPFARVWMLISRIPLPRQLMPRSIAMPDGRDMRIFPFAGGLLAFIASFPAWISSFVIPARPAAWIATAIYLACGWSLHIDGLGDLCDGLGSGRRGEKMRDVMKDSRVGSFAVCGIAAALALRSELVASLPSFSIIICAMCGAVGRVAACAAARVGTYPWGSGGISSGIVNGMKNEEMALAAASSLVFGIFAPLAWAIGVICSMAAGLLLSTLAERTLGGTNGDVLGAASVVGEIIALAVSVAVL